MSKKITDLTAYTTTNDNDLLEVATYVSPGNYASKKITFANFIARILGALGNVYSAVTSTVDGNIVVFSGTGGKVVKDSAVNIGSLGRRFYNPRYVISRPWDIADIFDSEIWSGGLAFATGDKIALLAQADPTENGFYIVGAATGDTARDPFFANAAACTNFLILAENPDENGNALVRTITSAGNLTSLNIANDPIINYFAPASATTRTFTIPNDTLVEKIYVYCHTTCSVKIGTDGTLDDILPLTTLPFGSNKVDVDLHIESLDTIGLVQDGGAITVRIEMKSKFFEL